MNEAAGDGALPSGDRAEISKTRGWARRMISRYGGGQHEAVWTRYDCVFKAYLVLILHVQGPYSPAQASRNDETGFAQQEEKRRKAFRS